MKPIGEWLNKIHCGNAYELLKQMPSESVDCVITSPPYYGLRDYGSGADTIFGGDPNCEHEWSEGKMTLAHENRNFLKGTQEEVHGKRGTTYIRKFDDRAYGFCVKCGAWRGQLGLEPDWRMYVEHLVELFREVKRVLKKTGSFWLNIGDTYAGSGCGRGDRTLFQNSKRKYIAEQMYQKPSPQRESDLPTKCLMGIPWRVAFALIDDGWILRNAVVWHKCLGGDVPIYAKSQGKVLRTTVRELARLPLDDLWLPGIDGGWRKVVRIEKQPESELITLHLRNGTKIEVTPEHIFVLSDGRLVEARNLKKGDCLMHSNLPSEVGTPLGTYENGWVVGLFLAEGNFLKDREAVVFSLNSTESDFSERLRKFAFRYAGSCREYNRGNCKTVLVSGEVPVAVIRHYVSGEQARNKHLSRSAFNESNEFLRGVLDGWLSGDGWYDEKNRRWRIRFTANRELEYDMKAICARLGLHMRSRWRRARGFGKEYPCIDAEIRETTRGHFNQKDDYEIIRIEKTKGISYDIEVDGDHLFLLYDGTVTHNSNHIPESVKDRLTRTYEYVFHFVKSKKYFYNLDNIREPHKAGNNIEEILRYWGADKHGEYRGKAVKDYESARAQNASEVKRRIIENLKSKYLATDVGTASPAARSIKMSEKLTPQVKQKVLAVGAYLKDKLTESGYTIKQLAEITGIKQTTLEHYFRTDFSGQMLPSREDWNLLKPLLGLGEYDEYIDEEIRQVLPQPHPIGRNSGDVWGINMTKHDLAVGRVGNFSYTDPLHTKGYYPLGKNPGDLWSINTRPFKEAHFATFPPELPLRPILASCPPDGVVLDPLAGSGTVAYVCELINRGMWDEFRVYVNENAKRIKWNLKWIMIEINPEYCRIMEKRLEPFIKQSTLDV